MAPVSLIQDEETDCIQRQLAALHEVHNFSWCTCDDIYSVCQRPDHWPYVYATNNKFCTEACLQHCCSAQRSPPGKIQGG